MGITLADMKKRPHWIFGFGLGGKCFCNVYTVFCIFCPLKPSNLYQNLSLIKISFNGNNSSWCILCAFNNPSGPSKRTKMRYKKFTVSGAAGWQIVSPLDLIHEANSFNGSRVEENEWSKKTFQCEWWNWITMEFIWNGMYGGGWKLNKIESHTLHSARRHTSARINCHYIHSNHIDAW